MLWEVSTIEPLPPCRIIAVCIHRAGGGRRRRQVVVDAVVVEATISSHPPCMHGEPLRHIVGVEDIRPTACGVRVGPYYSMVEAPTILRGASSQF